jgi:hypothetical protein
MLVEHGRDFVARDNPVVPLIGIRTSKLGSSVRVWRLEAKNTARVASPRGNSVQRKITRLRCIPISVRLNVECINYNLDVFSDFLRQFTVGTRTCMLYQKIGHCASGSGTSFRLKKQSAMADLLSAAHTLRRGDAARAPFVECA